MICWNLHVVDALISHIGVRSFERSLQILLRFAHPPPRIQTFLHSQPQQIEEHKRTLWTVLKCFMLWKLPNNQNCSFVVLSKPKDQLVILQPIIDELALKINRADKHLIFCRTYDETSYCFQIWHLV